MFPGQLLVLGDEAPVGDLQAVTASGDLDGLADEGEGHGVTAGRSARRTWATTSDGSSATSIRSPGSRPAPSASSRWTGPGNSAVARAQTAPHDIGGPVPVAMAFAERGQQLAVRQLFVVSRARDAGGIGFRDRQHRIALVRIR
jgi:hypothetical protein